jgi:hypothetical protein
VHALSAEFLNQAGDMVNNRVLHLAPAFPCAAVSLVPHIARLGVTNRRKDATRDIRYRQAFMVSDQTQEILDRKSVISLDCPRHGQFKANWMSLIYAGSSCPKQTCGSCDVEAGTIARRIGIGTHGRQLAEDLKRIHDIPIVGLETISGDVAPFEPEHRYPDSAYFILECQARIGDKACLHRTSQSVRNLKSWIKNPAFLRCQGEKCKQHRQILARSKNVQERMPDNWTAIDFDPRANEYWRIAHKCGYTLQVSWKQLLKLSESLDTRRGCPICDPNRIFPPPLGRTPDNLSLWFKKWVPTLVFKSFAMGSSGKISAIRVECRHHQGEYSITQRALMMKLSGGCEQCEAELRSAPRTRWPWSAVIVGSEFQILPKGGLWPSSPDEKTSWLGTSGQEYDERSLRNISKMVKLYSAQGAQFSGSPLPVHYAIAGWLQSDGYDLTERNRKRWDFKEKRGAIRIEGPRNSLRAGITLVAEDIGVLREISLNVRCLPRIGLRFSRLGGQTPGAYATLTITDERFIGWLMDYASFGLEKEGRGVPTFSMNFDEVTAYLAGLLGGDGHVSFERRGPLLSWLTVGNSAMRDWLETEVESLVLEEMQDPVAADHFMRTAKCETVNVFDALWPASAKAPKHRYTIAVNQHHACARLATRLLEWKHLLPARKVTMLKTLASNRGKRSIDSARYENKRLAPMSR